MNKYCPTCDERLDTTLSLCPKDGTRLVELAEDKMAGAVFDNKFKILYTAGQDSLGELYKAVYLKSKAVVALKTISPSVKLDAEQARRLQNGVKNQASLKHAGLAPAKGFGKAASIISCATS